MVNPDTDLEVNKDSYITVSYIPSLSEEFRIIFWHTNAKDIFKGANTLKSILLHPKDKITSQSKQDIVYKWSCP